ncbi:MAG: hypothetical protein KIT80_15155 [Chitinophagaceae bacterium]|nr:hypothetical protein [Chitinophagaceae bacterium]MCW5928252.1 hypothetical protein [Chitinophagaceae bacterium]
MKKLQLILEKGDGELWGRIEGKGDFMPVTVGKNAKEVIKNITGLISDYLKHEGKEDKAWKNIDVSGLTFDLVYDIQAFFTEHDYLTASLIAKRAGINPGLMRQYSSGVKYPSAVQAQKIEQAIKEVGKELSSVRLYAA